MGIVSSTLKLVDQMSGTLKSINLNLKEVNSNIKQTQNEANKIPNIFSIWNVAIGGVISNLITKIGSLGFSFVSAGINFNKEMQNYTSNFKVMLGSMDLATQKVKELQQFASVTPFGMQDLAQATKTLLSFGIEGEYTTGVLKMLGDVALGDVNKFNSLSLVFGQIMSQGKLMGGDLLQLINAGFNPLTVLAEKTGKSMSVLKEEMSRGAISAQMVAEAFQIATSEGGLFFNGMAEGSKTFAGTYSTMMDNINSTLGLLFEPLTNGLHSMMNVVISILNMIQPSIQAFRDFCVENAEAIKVVLLALGAISMATAIRVAIAWLMANWQIVAVTLIVVGAIYGIIKVLSFFGITTDSVLGFVGGAFNFTVAFIINMLISLGDYLLMFVNLFINSFGTLANFLGNVFHSPISSVIKMFEGMANQVLTILKGIAKAVDAIFGSNLAGIVGNWQANITKGANALIAKYAPNEKYKEVVGKKELSMEGLGIKRKNLGDAYNSGYKWGSDLGSKLNFGGGGIGGFGSSNVGGFINSLGKNQNQSSELSGIGKGVKGINDKLGGSGSLKSVGETKIKDENLKYLQDIAQLKYLQQYQSKETQRTINVTVSTGDINSGSDENQLTSKIVNNLIDALDNNLVGA